jgi:hypothetical protein
MSGTRKTIGENHVFLFNNPNFQLFDHHMSHMDHHIEERRKIGWQTLESTFKRAILPSFDK